MHQLYQLLKQSQTPPATTQKQPESTLFAEFEMVAQVEAGEALTAYSLSETYKQIVAKYYGRVCIIDPQIAIEWARR